MSGPRRFLSPAWLRQSSAQTYERICDTPAKKLSTKVILGVGLGTAGIYLCHTLFRRLRESTAADTVTLRGLDAPVSLKLIDKVKVTNDTRRLRFALPSPHHTVGVPAGNYLYVSATINGKKEVRPYTPVSGEHNERGHMDIIVKVYPPTQGFPQGGLMSQYLDKLAIGDEISVHGPAGLINYQGNGVFEIKTVTKAPPARKTIKRIGMIAGGSGVTAMIPILHKMLVEPSESPKCSLLLTNKTEKDIILREELTRLAAKYRHRLKVWYNVDKPIAKDWRYGAGTVGEQTLKDWMPRPEAGVLILICGPKGMVDAVKAELMHLNYTSDMVFAF